MDPDHYPAVVVYGDDDTVVNYAENIAELAQMLGVHISAWHSDPAGTRSAQSLDDADGLVSALSDCARLGASLLVPYPLQDMPGERARRLVAHWLHHRGLQLFLGPAPYEWDRPVDEVDFAIRRTLDACYALDTAVIAREAVPAMEAVLFQLVGGATNKNAWQRQPDADKQLVVVRLHRQADLAAGLPVPVEPDPTAPWSERRHQICAFISWLSRHLSQAVIAEVLNAMGAKPRRGGSWSQPMVSRLLRAHTAAQGGAEAA